MRKSKTEQFEENVMEQVVDTKSAPPSPPLNETSFRNPIQKNEKLTIKTSTGGEELTVVEEEKEIKEYKFPTTNFALFLLTAIECENFVKNGKEDKWLTFSGGTFTYDYDYEKTAEVLIGGRYMFNYKNCIYAYAIDSKKKEIILETNNGKYVKEISDIIRKNVKESSILKRKNLFLYQTDSGIAWKIKKIPGVTYESMILEQKLKDDIEDDVLIFLQEMEESNGILLYGPPGTGKSLASSAIINKAIQMGFSTCHMTSMIEYIELNDFLETILAPAVVIIEDIDAIGMSRDISHNAGLSVFLQFMNGIAERDNRIVVVATTNHLDKLDSAIKDRPQRFNARYHINYPGNEELSKIIDLYFKDIHVVPDYLKQDCYLKNFTGAHIKTIQQKYILMTKKEKNKDKPFEELFKKATQTIVDQFGIKDKPQIGFMKD